MNYSKNKQVNETVAPFSSSFRILCWLVGFILLLLLLFFSTAINEAIQLKHFKCGRFFGLVVAFELMLESSALSPSNLSFKEI